MLAMSSFEPRIKQGEGSLRGKEDRTNGSRMGGEREREMERWKVTVMTYHSRSLYMMVKKTWRNRFTALINTANRYNHASPDILMLCCLMCERGSR